MRRLSHGGRVFLYAVSAGTPALVLAGWGLRRAGMPWDNTALALVALSLVTIACASAARSTVERPLQTLANLLSALREEDYSFRARVGTRDDALGEVTTELNTLAELLKSQRLGALEATALLRTVMEEIDVAVFALNEERQVRLVNRAGGRLLGRPVERTVGYDAATLGLSSALALAARGGGVVEAMYAGKPGRWEVRGGSFRQGGRQHQLLVMSDVSRALRDEEREAWQKLIRVMGHEINNSLAPIKSVAASLESALRKDPPPPDLRDDLAAGLSIVEKRADALARFTAGYAQLARLPSPRASAVPVADIAMRIAGLVPVEIIRGSDVSALVDADQIEQSLLNLVRNGHEAALPLGGGVRLGWSTAGRSVVITVEDDGPGIESTANLFVPFFTTKDQGTGIGLVLSRQIVEQNGGTLTLTNRENARGAVARMTLPQG